MTQKTKITPQLMVASIMSFGVGLVGLSLLVTCFYIQQFFKRVNG